MVFMVGLRSDLFARQKSIRLQFWWLFDRVLHEVFQHKLKNIRKDGNLLSLIESILH